MFLIIGDFPSLLFFIFCYNRANEENTLKNQLSIVTYIANGFRMI